VAFNEGSMETVTSLKLKCEHLFDLQDVYEPLISENDEAEGPPLVG
jgi:hypothetical protein